MGLWAFLVNCLLPLPLVMLLLLSIPLPQKYSKVLSTYIIKFVDILIFSKLFGTGFNIYQIATISSFVLFFITSFETFAINRYEKGSSGMFDPLRDEKTKCERWRFERNFWISFFSFTSWLVLFRVMSLAKEVNSLKKSGKKSE